MSLVLRFVLLIVLIATFGLIASLFRRVGAGEWAILLAVLAVVIAAESARYIGRQLLKGYRGQAAKPTKRTKQFPPRQKSG